MNPEEQIGARVGEEVAAHTAQKIAKIVAAVVGGVFLVVFLGFFLGWAIQFLWNYTLAEMFDWPTISYWQAVAVFILAKIFFGFGHSGGHAKQNSEKSEKDKEEKERVRRWWGRRMGMTYDESSPSNDEVFKKYWQKEGKAAYEAYVAAGKERPQDDASR